MTANTNTVILKIGSKGEIFPPKIIREKLGFEPNQPIILFVHQDQLIVRKIYTMEEILNVPPKTKMIMDIEKYKLRMKECIDNGDIEIGHIIADDLLCEILNELNHGDIVELYRKVKKWHA